MSRRMPLSAPALIVLALIAVGLTGCGQKGPLYHPGNEQAAEEYDPAGAYEEGDAQPPAEKADDGQPSEGSTE